MTIKYKNAPQKGLADYIVVAEDILPKITQGLPYFEYDTVFNAEVPYELDGWRNCIDLRNIPNIKEMVETYFKELGNMIIRKDFTSFKKAHSSKSAEVNFSIYLSYSDALKQLNELCEDFKQIETMTSLNGYKLVFYADGRLVSLESPDTKEIGFHMQSSEYIWPMQYLLGIREESDKLEIIM